MRIPFIAANWKMYKTVHEAVAFVKEFRSLVKDVDRRRDRRRAAVHGAARGRGGGAQHARSASPAQNLHCEREGAFTGEVSAAMMKDAGAEYVIVGHSERRRLFGETDETVNRKLRAALGAELTPIVCIGETLEERERDETLDGARPPDQARARRPDRRSGRRRWSIAYEPVWAIGTGRNATPAAGRRGARAHPRRGCGSGSAAPAADQCHILYGGSVKPDNIHELDRCCRTSTARWSAAPAWTSGRFVEIVAQKPPDARYNRPLMLYYLVVGLYVLVCFLLLLVVLLQQGKGGDMASAFGGGGSQTAFGARAGATVLTRRRRFSACCSCSARSRSASWASAAAAR